MAAHMVRNCSFLTEIIKHRPVKSQLEPWGYKQHGALYRSSSTGARLHFVLKVALFSNKKQRYNHFLKSESQNNICVPRTFNHI